MNFRNLLLGSTQRLRYVWRWSGTPVLARESVAEHSYYTALFSLFIMETIEPEQLAEIDRHRVLQDALIHDMEEAITGDIPRPFKHGNARSSQFFSRAGRDAMKSVSAELYDDFVEAGWLTRRWQHCKNDSDEGRIVRFADFCSVLSYIWQEAERNGPVLRDERLGLQEYAQSFLIPAYDFIRPLPRLAKEVALEPAPQP